MERNSYSPHKIGKSNENGTYEESIKFLPPLEPGRTNEESGKFLPVLEPGLDALDKNPDEVAFVPISDTTPPDRYRMVFIIMVINGIGILMPWNMMINAKDYFEKYKLKSDEPEVVELRSKFMFYLGIFAQVPNFLMSGVNTFCQCGGQASPRRIIVSISIMVVVFVATVILAMVDSDSWSVEFFWITMATAVILNMATGVYQNSSFGLAAILPMKYTNAIVLGTNLSGVFVSIVNVICLITAPDPRTQAIYYFVAAVVVLLIAFDAYFLLPLLINQQMAPPQAKVGLRGYPPLTNFFFRLEKFYRYYKDMVEMTQNQSTEPSTSTLADTCSRFGRVFKKIWVQAIGVWFTFFVTLTVFPGIWSNVQKNDFPLEDSFFVAIFCFVSFNLFAFIGNIVSAWVQVPGPKYVWIPIALRGLLIPFFLLCRFKLETRNIPVLIENDIIYIIGGVILAFTSGYFSSLTMMYGPKQVDPEIAGTAGMIMAFFLVLGITSGVNFSLIIASVFTDDIPRALNSTIS